MISRANARRIAIAVTLGAGVLLTYPAVSGGLGWDLAAACGYASLILIVSLYIFPVRGDGLPHGRLMGLSQHKTIGWYVLAAAVVHVLLLLLYEPQTARYLLPSAPVFMWCGVLALLMLTGSVFIGLSARRRMRRVPLTRYSTVHVVLAALLMLTACAHIVGSAQLLSAWFKCVTVLLLMCLPLGWSGLRSRPGGFTSRQATAVVAVVVIALLPAAMSKQLLLQPMARPARIAVNFPHDSHTSVNCVTCHHNYVDHTGTTACIECHRAVRSDLTQSSEAIFHSFCRDCHASLALDGARHGPTRSCSACHQGIRSSNL